MQLANFRKMLTESKMKLFKPISEKPQDAKLRATYKESSLMLLSYTRDYLINMIDIAVDKRFAKVFNRQMVVCLRVLVELLETEDIMSKLTELDVTLGFVWKILV